MSIEQKVIYIQASRTGHADSITGKLNLAAKDGWRIQSINALIVLKGGGIYIGERGYYTDIFQVLLEKSSLHYSYKCFVLPLERIIEDDIKALNSTIDIENKEEYRLAHVMQMACISTDQERETPGTFGHLLIFDKEEHNI